MNYTVGPSAVVYSSPAVTIGYSGVESLTINATQGPNVFDATPSLTTTYSLNGNGPGIGTVPGNNLIVHTAAIPSPTVTYSSNTPGSGTWTFGGGYQNISFTGIGSTAPTIAISTPKKIFAASADIGAGSQPLVQLYDEPTHQVLFQFYAYATTFKGGVQVALDDTNNDGTPDFVIVSPGSGIVGQIKMYSYAALLAVPKNLDGITVTNPAAAGVLVGTVNPDGANTKFGYNLALGDLWGNGEYQLITSRQHGVSQVKVYAINTVTHTFTQCAAWQPYSKTLINGAVVASGDVAGLTGANKWEVVTGPGAGIATTIKVYSFTTTGTPLAGTLTVFKTVPQFNAFESKFKGGVSLAVGNTDGIGLSEIMVGAGAGGGSRVRIFDVNGTTGVQQNQFVAFSGPKINAPVHLATINPGGIGRTFLLASQGNSGSHEFAVFDPLTGANVDLFFATADMMSSGIFVA